MIGVVNLIPAVLRPALGRYRRRRTLLAFGTVSVVAAGAVGPTRGGEGALEEDEDECDEGPE